MRTGSMQKQSSLLSFFRTIPNPAIPLPPFRSVNVTQNLHLHWVVNANGLKRKHPSDADDQVHLRASKRARIPEVVVISESDDSEQESSSAGMGDELQSEEKKSPQQASVILLEEDLDQGSLRDKTRDSLLSEERQLPKPVISGKFGAKPNNFRATSRRGSVRQPSLSTPVKRRSSPFEKFFCKKKIADSKEEDKKVCQPNGKTLGNNNIEASTNSSPSSKVREPPLHFSALRCHNRSEDGPFDLTRRTISGKQQHAREKLTGLDRNVRAIATQPGGLCEKYAWTVDIRDAKKRKPDHPNYDKTTLYVPPNLLSDTRGKKVGGLSPLQRQFWSIKMVNYDVIIFFKKGMFYEMYDCDADIAHKELGLSYTRSGRAEMRCCGVPETAFDKHSARFIELGYKVGRVEQTETANTAEKRTNGIGSSSASVCRRSLVQIMTKATVTEDGLLRDHRARYVLAITEEVKGNRSTGLDQSTSIEDESIEGRGTKTVGCCYVDAASSCVTISQFEDDLRMTRTERLLALLRPHELIVQLSVASSRLKNIVKWYSRSNESEVCDLSRKKGFPAMTESWLAKYLLTKSDPDTLKQDYEKVCKHMRKFSLSCKAFGAIAQHLKSLIIDKETLSLGNYTLFPEIQDNEEITEQAGGRQKAIPLPMASSARLRMDAPTLQNLEILCCGRDGSENGSLLSFVDHAQTPAGRRLI